MKIDASVEPLRAIPAEHAHPALRVLMLTGRADASGGPEHIYQLTRQLRSRCEVFIAAPPDRPYWARFSELVGRERMIELPHRQISMRALAGVVSVVRAQRVHLLHSHGRSGGIYGRLARIATGAVSVHTPHLPHTFDSLKAWGYWAADWALSARTSHLIAVSPSEEASIRRQFLRRRGLSTIPNGVVVPFEPVDADNFQRQPRRIVHVTRFVPQKNTEMVLAILERLRTSGRLDEFHVDILGDGAGRRALEEEARSRGLKRSVTFHGTCDSIGPHLARAFALLSTSRWEGMPLAVLEAMAAGLPSVVSDVPGNRDVVTDRVGRRFPGTDADAAADRLLELADHPGLWCDLSRSSRQVAQQQFSAERMAAETFAIYERVLETRKLAALRRAAINPCTST